MNIFAIIFTTLVSSFLAYWFCGHCMAVARNGGPRGDGYEPYQRAVHPIRFRFYVVVVGIIGLVLAIFAIYGFFRLWKKIAPPNPQVSVESWWPEVVSALGVPSGMTGDIRDTALNAKYNQMPNPSQLTPDPPPVPAVMTAITSTRSRSHAPGEA